MTIKRIHIAGRAQLENKELWKADGISNCLWITITDPELGHCDAAKQRMSNNDEAVLGLEFHDAWGKMLTTTNFPFSRLHAKKVLNFVEPYHKDNEDFLLVINCMMGWSRSAALAKVLAEYVDCSKVLVFSDIRGVNPNPHVVNVMEELINNQQG